MLTFVLAGCGGGASNTNLTPLSNSGTSSSTTSSTTSTTGKVAVTTTVSATKAVPATTRSLRITLTQNGVLVVATGLTNPSTFPATAGSTQTNTIANVPPGSYTVLTEALDATGTVLGVNAGSATVTAGNTAPVTVTQVQTVNSIAVSPSTATIAAGGKQQESATATLSDNSQVNVTVLGTWSSSSTSTATVSNTAGSQGVVTGVAAGTATITMTYGGVSGTATITVSGTTPSPSPSPSPATSPSPSPGVSPSPSPSPTPSPTTVNVTNTNLNNWVQRTSGLQANDFAFKPSAPTAAVIVGNNGFIASFDSNNVMTIRKSGVAKTINLNAVVWQGPPNNTFVAVGDAGTILTSPDGATWTPATTNPAPATTNLLDVCKYTNGVSGFMAVGTSDGTKGWILHSVDGKVWTDISVAANNVNYTACAIGPIAGNGFAEVVSDTAAQCQWQQLGAGAGPVGANWAATASTHAGMRTITFATAAGVGFFALSGDQGWVDINAAGNTWAAASTAQIGAGTYNAKGVAYGSVGAVPKDTLTFTGTIGATIPAVFVDNTFTAVNTGHTYVAGTAKFTSVGTPNYAAVLNKVRFANTKFNAAGGGAALLQSVDGSAYTVSSYTADIAVNGVATGAVAGAPVMVAVGASDLFNLFGANRPLVQTSSDGGSTWTRRDPGAITTDLVAVAFGNGRFVAITAAGLVITSADGVTWAPPGTNGLTNRTYAGVTFGNVGGVGKFVAVGNGWIGVADNTGNNWVETANGQPFAKGVAFGSVGSPATGIFVECAQAGKTSWSNDLVTWTNVTTGQADDLFGITFNTNTFVVVGAAGRIQTSTDGKVFVNNSTFGANPLRAVTGITTPNAPTNFLGYVAVGDNGATFTATNPTGIWTAATSQNFTTENLLCVAVQSASASVLNTTTNVTTVTFTNIFAALGLHNTGLNDQ